MCVFTYKHLTFRKGRKFDSFPTTKLMLRKPVDRVYKQLCINKTLLMSSDTSTFLT